MNNNYKQKKKQNKNILVILSQFFTMASKYILWNKKLDLLETFFKENTRRPSSISNDENEKVLGSWISSQLKNRVTCQHIMSNKKNRDIWDSFTINRIIYFRSNECVWYKKLEELRSFFELNKRRPIQTSPDIDEIILARWVSNQLIIRRQKDIESTLNISLRITWDAFKANHMEYFKSNQDIWYEKLNELKLFFEIKKMVPSPIAEDEIEKVLSNWLSNQLLRRKKNLRIMANEKIRDDWDTFKITHIKYFKSNEDVWYEKLNELKLFFETNKILPSPIANDEKEKLLCIWLSHQIHNRSVNKQMMLYENIRNSWDNFKHDYIKAMEKKEKTKKRKYLE